MFIHITAVIIVTINLCIIYLIIFIKHLSGYFTLCFNACNVDDVRIKCTYNKIDKYRGANRVVLH